MVAKREFAALSDLIPMATRLSICAHYHLAFPGPEQFRDSPILIVITQPQITPHTPAFLSVKHFTILMNYALPHDVLHAPAFTPSLPRPSFEPVDVALQMHPNKLVI